jgi:homoaconitate hydratase
MPQTFVEAVASVHAVGWQGPSSPAAGDVVWLRPARVMTHDNSSAILARFRRMGAHRVADPSRCVIVLDHDVQNRSASNLAKYAAIEAFAREQGIEFHPAGSGVGHQVMIDRALVRPGELCVAADSHANTYGALGALGVAITRSDAAAVWSSGTFWWEIPESVRVHLEGALPEGATGKDAALILCALYPDDVVGAAVEFGGPGAWSLPVDDRITMSNLTTEWGAASGVFPAGPPEGVDPGARYAATITLDLTAVVPHVSGPDALAPSRPVSAAASERIAIQKAYLVSCANGRRSDFESAARVLRGRHVAPGVELYMAAASAAVQRAAEASGAWGALVDAGAIPLPAGCGPCIGLGAGLLAPGETGISASNRNFKGRMGSPAARCYLASPAVVAASAAAGFICGPSPSPATTPERRIVRQEPAGEGPSSDAAAGGPRITGRLVAFLRDGIDTDALCPARLVYADGAPAAELAGALFESIDPAFASSVRPGDILAAGLRFGTGSSREQAVAALQAAGIVGVVAESLAPTFRRNAWNNGFLAVERPAVVRALRDRFPGPSRTARFTDETITLDTAWLPAVARDLVAAGGLDAYLRALRQDADD